MSHEADTATDLDSVVKSGTRLKTLTHRLRAYRPRWRDRRFWVLQALVIVLASLHIIVDTGAFPHSFDVLYFLPATLLLVPVVFAALTYGFVGAIATTLWVVILTMPDLVFWHHGLQRIGVIATLLLLSGIASFIGRQVDRERGMLQEIGKTATALRASTAKYRRLLESIPVPVLVSSLAGAILEVNPAATVLFGKDKATLESLWLADLFGNEAAEKLLSWSSNVSQPGGVLSLNAGGRELFLEPLITETDDGKGNPMMEIVLRDVTEEYQRHAGLRAYAAEIIRAVEEERQKMARELHDETIQTVILMCRQLDDIEEMAESLPSAVVTRLKEARRRGEDVLKGLRDFVMALRPPSLDDLGITVSIRRLLADFTDRTGIEGHITVAGQDRRLPSDTELGIFRIAQEALHNVERHARADYVAVIMTFAEHGVELAIVDNGVGFPMSTASSYLAMSGHFGLISMQERAQLLNGSLVIHSSPGKGTKVLVSIPYAAGAQ